MDPVDSYVSTPVLSHEETGAALQAKTADAAAAWDAEHPGQQSENPLHDLDPN
eukprot:SAG22_NODE_3799_length_1525_cov_31.475823_2_plen_53_part_00